MEYSNWKPYTIKIQNFEGPLDLLFHLIEKNQMDIYDIAINEITDQYMEYLYQMQEMDMELASEFIVMAATLLYIKSKMLLPDKKEKKEEESDPMDELVQKLVEYKRFKELAVTMAERGKVWEHTFYRLPEIIKIDKPFETLVLSPYDLVKCYKDICDRNEKKFNKNAKNMDVLIEHEKVSITSKIKEILRNLTRYTKFKFSEIFNLKRKSRTEVVTAFLAMLELAKVKKVTLEQKSQWGDIFVSKYTEQKSEEESEVTWK